MRKINVLYIISGIDKALAFEWIYELIDKDRFNLNFVLIGNSNTGLASFLKNAGAGVYEVPYKTNLDLPVVFLKVWRHLLVNRVDVVHTHLFIANLVGLTAAFLSGIPKRIYTRHHAIIHHREAKSGLKWDKVANRLSTQVIAISQNVKSILVEMENVPGQKVIVIPHGFKLHYFHEVSMDRVHAIRSKYHISSEPVVGVIARYTHWKGIQFVIGAFKQLLIDFPNAVLVLANAHGDYKNEIKKLLQDLPPQRVVEIKFEQDLAALYKVFDVYVHVPIDDKSEAFGQTYVESLASGVPSVFTLSGIAAEFVMHRKNAIVVSYQDSEQIYKGVKLLLLDKSLSNELVENGKNIVKEKFSVDEMISKLERCYMANSRTSL